ncbi:helix-turn-helix domain-containing protein [Paraburkholderia sp. 2C]
MQSDVPRVSSAQAAVATPAPMFSAPGHPETIWSDVNGTVNQSRHINWAGGTAAAHRIGSVAGAARIVTHSVALQFSWNGGFVEADAESGKHVFSYRNRPRYGLVLPPGSEVEFRIKEKSNYRFLSIELQPEYILQTCELQHLSAMDILETWGYDHPLSWQLAHLLYEECEREGRQGLLYLETAVTLLSLHLVRHLSTFTGKSNLARRGGLPPTVCKRVCDYMIARLHHDLSLTDVASLCGLSTGHFSFAFRQSMGMPPHAWLRAQRIERAKALLRDNTLSFPAIGLAVGFANQSSFGVAFRKETGLSPSAWRRSVR